MRDSDRDLVHERVLDGFNAALSNALDSMTPTKMLQYLTGTGWRFTREVQHPPGQVWTLYRGREIRGWVTVPTATGDDDYSARMREAMRRVLVVEDWPMALTMALIFPPGLR